ncbi:MAG TPA: hypothetical protein VIM73_01140 [Polyangiaceae bacterium]
MATKDLSRTVIEGGRASFNRWDRRYWLVSTEPGGYRQARALDADDRERWLALSAEQRARYSGFKVVEREKS